MKAAAILIVLLAVAVVACVTRPSEQSFAPFLRQELGLGPQVASEEEAQIFAQMLKRYRYRNRLLWADMERTVPTPTGYQRQIAYTGIFGRWMVVNAVSDPVAEGPPR